MPPPPPLAGDFLVDSDATQDLVLLLEPPAFIRVYLEVDGVPFRSFWRDHIAKLQASVDSDGDGALSPEEVSNAVSSTDASPEVRQMLQDTSLWNFDLLPTDQRLTSEELVLAAESRRGGAFQETASTSTAFVQDAVFTTGSNRPPGEVLFESLDADENGRLTADEVETGRQSLTRLDFDFDGNASLSEMEYTRNPFQGQTQFGAASEGVPVQAINRSQGLATLIDELLRRYGDEPRVARGERLISSGMLGLPSDVFAVYDRDGNDRLDRRELRALLEDPPVTLALTVRIGRREPGQAQVEVRSTAPWSDAAIKTSDAGIASLLVDRFQIEIHAGQSTAAEYAQLFSNLFMAFDRDANAYLEQDEVRGTQMEGVFDRFDVNHDGMLYEDEMLSIVEADSAAALSRTRLSSSNRGRDFFEILDENRDRRISPRELEGISPRIGIWDENDDSGISEGEIPQLYQLTFDRGQPDFPGLYPQGVVAVSPSPSAPAQAVADGPIWFQRMDRNDDGDVSRREFLGTDEQFQSIDIDGDALISPNEAALRPDRQSDAN